MRAGCRCGRGSDAALPLGLFVREDGYTTVAVASALLVSVALVLSVATATWTSTRAGEVQDVADAAALAGANVVASYCTIAQVVDACILSLGVTGITLVGTGLIVAAIPGAQRASGEVLEAGKRVLEARNRFARSSVEALKKIEGALPAVVVANAWRCVRANAQEGRAFTGAAVPLPLSSASDFSSLEGEVDATEVEAATQDLQDATKVVEEAKRRADDARTRAWTADCVDSPRCMRSRAQDLAGLAGAMNPDVASPELWTFGVAIQRARAYYAARLAQDEPEADDVESLADSCARRAFYAYALEEVNGAYYHEHDDGSVDLQVPHLARTVDEVRATRLYTDEVWPCTQEEAGTTLHATLACPGAHGASAGAASVATLEAGTLVRCPECGMDVADLAAVASISTIATNGFEHYWQIVVDEAQQYAQARNDQAQAEQQAREVAREGNDAFERLLKSVSVPRPRICPAGAWGCVSMVACAGGEAPAPLLTSTFVGDVRLPAGAAVSAATLAPDAQGANNTVLARLFDGVGEGSSGTLAGVGGSVAGLWSRVLSSYGSAYGSVEAAATSFFDKIDGVFGGTVGSWLKGKLAQAMSALGLEPADLRLRKPVLTSTANVLERAGLSKDDRIRTLIEALPANGTAAEVAQALGIAVGAELLGQPYTLGTLEIPGTGVSVPLSVDVAGGGVP